MKPEFLGLRTVIYHVADIAKAKSWYSKAFGCEPYFDQPFYVGFNIGGFELGLHPEQKPVTDKAQSVVAYWGVNNVDEVFQEFIRLGAVQHEKPQNVGGDIVVASVKDPWGNLVGIIFNPDFKITP